MLLTISAESPDSDLDGPVPATDLGFLLHKHPDNLRSVSTTGGHAHVFWPRADADGATVALLVEIDPIGLVRRGAGGRPLAPYINDRPYVASSLFSVALGKLFRSALNGDCPSRPDLVELQWPIDVTVPAAPFGPDHGLVHRLFDPLGYDVEVIETPLDAEVEGWGSADVGTLRLRATTSIRELLRHLYVLLPVLDADKHYWIDETEVRKLLKHGEGWLAGHPEHSLIVPRYLGNFSGLTDLANEQLAESMPASDGSTVDGLGETADEKSGEPAGETGADAAERLIEKPLSLNDQRLAMVRAAILEQGPSTVVDLGCGEGKLIQHLAHDTAIDKIIGVDVAPEGLRRAGRRLRLDQRADRQRPAIELRQSSLTYRDGELADPDVACLIEVIEHLDPPRLDAVETILFRHTRPKTLIVTTPNREYNHLFNLMDGTLRHRDHRFEWTRGEFAEWCRRVCEEHGYSHELRPIGPVDDTHGAPTQMAVLTRGGGVDRRGDHD